MYQPLSSSYNNTSRKVLYIIHIALNLCNATEIQCDMLLLTYYTPIANLLSNHVSHQTTC